MYGFQLQCAVHLSNRFASGMCWSGWRRRWQLHTTELRTGLLLSFARPRVIQTKALSHRHHRRDVRMERKGEQEWSAYARARKKRFPPDKHPTKRALPLSRWDRVTAAAACKRVMIISLFEIKSAVNYAANWQCCVFKATVIGC